MVMMDTSKFHVHITIIYHFVDNVNISGKTCCMDFEEKLLLVAKWVAIVIIFFGLVLPFNILWFLIFPVIMIVRKKWKPETAAQTEMNFFTPIEMYSQIIKRLMGLD